MFDMYVIILKIVTINALVWISIIQKQDLCRSVKDLAYLEDIVPLLDSFELPFGVDKSDP